MKPTGGKQRFGMAAREVRWRVFSENRMRRWLDDRIELGRSKWCFLVGVNNSGTTLLMDIMTRHREISGIRGEGHQLTTAFPKPWDYGVPRIWTEREDVFRWTERDEGGSALRAAYDWSHYLAPAKYFLEKSPPNTIRSRWLQKHFQASHFVALVRSPYAVCEGMRRREGYDIARAARHWARANEILLEDWEHLNFKLLLSYEAFCEDCLGTLNRIGEFLALDMPFDAEIVEADFHVHDSTEKVRNMNGRSLERLSADDLRIIDEIAGPMMERLGYETISTVMKN